MPAVRPARSPAGEHQRRPCAARASIVCGPSPPPGGRKPSTSRPRPASAATPRPSSSSSSSGDSASQPSWRQPCSPTSWPAAAMSRSACGIELGVQALDEEGRAQVQRGERIQRARQPDGHRRVRAARRRAVALEVGGLAEVVEAQQDGVAQGAAHAGSPSATGVTGGGCPALHVAAHRAVLVVDPPARARVIEHRGEAVLPLGGGERRRRGGAGRRCAPTHDRRGRGRRRRRAPRGSARRRPRARPRSS